MVYGMRSCALNFTRFPVIASACARRVAAALVGSYMDDFQTVDSVAAMGTGQEFMQKSITGLGGAQAPEKHTGQRTQQIMLGINVRSDVAHPRGKVIFEPRGEYVAKARSYAWHPREKILLHSRGLEVERNVRLHLKQYFWQDREVGAVSVEAPTV